MGMISPKPKKSREEIEAKESEIASAARAKAAANRNPLASKHPDNKKRRREENARRKAAIYAAIADGITYYAARSERSRAAAYFWGTHLDRLDPEAYRELVACVPRDQLQDMDMR